jgi:HEAT repeat protein
MRPAAVLRRKCGILMAVLNLEESDSDYRALADEVAGLLPELLLHGDYDDAERALSVFAGHCELHSERSDAQRKKAAEVMDQFYDRKTLRQLVRESIGSVDDDAEAISKIFQIGGPTIISGLLETLAIEDSRRVRQRLVRMLASMGGDVVEILKDHLDDPRWYFVRNLVLIIGEAGDASLVPSLEVTLSHEDFRVRRETVLALMRMRDEFAGDLLLRATHDRDPEVRLYAVYALGKSGLGRPRARLEQILRLSNWRGQNTELIQTAAIALGRLGDQRAAQPLVRLSEQKIWLFRARRAPTIEAAAWAVGTLMGVDVGSPPEVSRLASLETSSRSLFRR